MNAAQHVLAMAVRIYQVTISPVLTCLFGSLGLGCRFHPTCSQYALEAVQRHGAIKGTMLAVGRICRCHPWGGCGEDRVPEQFQISDLKSCLSRGDGALERGRLLALCESRDTPKASEDRRTPKPGRISNHLSPGDGSVEVAHRR